MSFGVSSFCKQQGPTSPYALSSVDEILVLVNSKNLGVWRITFDPAFTGWQPFIQHFLDNCDADLIVDYYHLTTAMTDAQWTASINKGLQVAAAFPNYQDRLWLEPQNEQHRVGTSIERLAQKTKEFVDALRAAGYTNKVVSNIFWQNVPSLDANMIYLSNFVNDSNFYTGHHIYLYGNNAVIWQLGDETVHYVNGAENPKYLMRKALDAGVKIMNTEVGADAGEINYFTAQKVAETKAFMDWSYENGVGNTLWLMYGDYNWPTYESMGFSFPVVVIPPVVNVSLEINLWAKRTDLSNTGPAFLKYLNDAQVDRVILENAGIWQPGNELVSTYDAATVQNFIAQVKSVNPLIEVWAGLSTYYNAINVDTKGNTDFTNIDKCVSEVVALWQSWQTQGFGFAGMMDDSEAYLGGVWEHLLYYLSADSAVPEYKAWLYYQGYRSAQEGPSDPAFELRHPTSKDELNAILEEMLGFAEVAEFWLEVNHWNSELKLQWLRELLTVDPAHYAKMTAVSVWEFDKMTTSERQAFIDFAGWVKGPAPVDPYPFKCPYGDGAQFATEAELNQHLTDAHKPIPSGCFIASAAGMTEKEKEKLRKIRDLVKMFAPELVDLYYEKAMVFVPFVEKMFCSYHP